MIIVATSTLKENIPFFEYFQEGEEISLSDDIGKFIDIANGTTHEHPDEFFELQNTLFLVSILDSMHWKIQDTWYG